MGAYEYPAAPYIVVPSRRITFIKDRPNGLEKTLQIRNCGSGKLKWKITEDCQWLEVSPIKGTSSGEINEVTLAADTNGLSVGEYRCRITIADKKAINSPVTIDVILHIGSLLHVPAEYSTIQEAIDAASDWDTVLVADGVYKGVGNRDIDFRGKKIQLKSENGAENCIIDCNGLWRHRGFDFHSGEDADSILDGLTITNGYGGIGGGIYCGASSPTITNCTFRSNSSGWDGGAMCNRGRNSVIANCTFSDNSAGYYGDGGAIHNSGRNSTVTNCTFSGNSAEYHGDGGAIHNAGRNFTVTNCTFSGNSAERWGGAINNTAGSLAITNCAFTGNSAEKGGVMRNDGRNSVVTNCILWGNGPWQIYSTSSTVVTYSDVQGGWEGVGNIDAEPLFVDPCNGDYHLLEDSPCIDAGDPNYVAGPNETDLDGNPRVVGGRIDMGAYELQPLTPAELLLDLTDYLDELSLHKGIVGSLQSKLEAALQLLEDDNENNDGAAINLLEAFINTVQAQYDKKIPAADADALIAAAQEIIELLGG
jgi:hypothetical protein